MGTKSSKSKIDDNSKCAKYCTLVYGPELSEDSKSNDKWTLECTVQVEKSVDHTYFGAIGWKPGGYFGIQVCYLLKSCSPDPPTKSCLFSFIYFQNNQ